MALDRVVEPFVAAAQTSQVDRRWEELTDREQEAYRQRAPEREMILLDRAPDLQRIQSGAPNRLLLTLRRRRPARRRATPAQGRDPRPGVCDAWPAAPCPGGSHTSVVLLMVLRSQAYRA